MPTESKNTDSSSLFVEIPTKYCVSIGKRKRYFATKELALAALTEFNEKMNRPKQHRNRLTTKEKAAKAKRYEIYAVIAAHAGYTGKRAAMAANAYEELCKIPGVLGCVAKYADAIKTGRLSDLSPMSFDDVDCSSGNFDKIEGHRSLPFTERFIEELKPKKQRYFIRESKGFAIRVQPSGLKTWFYICTIKGRRKHLNLGVYPDVSLVDARELYKSAFNSVATDTPVQLASKSCFSCTLEC